MPPEYYLGAAVAVIVVILLASFLRGQRVKQRSLPNGLGSEQLTTQLSRIADSLEAIVAQLRASPLALDQRTAPLEKPLTQKLTAEKLTAERPPAEKPPAQKPPEEQPSVPAAAGAEQSGEQKHHYVTLSMFGR
jgi:hypothetical protein